MGECEGKLLKVALFDMAATTVDDMVQKPGSSERMPLVLAAYESAFLQGGVEMPYDELNMCRGRNKLEVFNEKVAKYRANLSTDEQKRLAQSLHDDHFVPSLLENVPYIGEIKGTTEAFKYLHDRGVFVASGTGFPKVVADAINEQLGWVSAGVVDYATCKAVAGAGRPEPNMINDTLIRAGLLPEDTNKSSVVSGFDYGTVLKVGDTVKDVEEGQSVNATNIAVSSGTQPIEKLVAASPLIVLPSVEVLPLYLENHGFQFPR
jgi:phosphoglycolate phosphatase-like HAD superfamily hydrolase